MVGAEAKVVFKTEEELTDFIEKNLPLIDKAIRWIYADTKTYEHVSAAFSKFVSAWYAYYAFKDNKGRVSDKELARIVENEESEYHKFHVEATWAFDARAEIMIPDEYYSPFTAGMYRRILYHHTAVYSFTEWDEEYDGLFKVKEDGYEVSLRYTSLVKKSAIVHIPALFIRALPVFKRTLVELLDLNNKWIDEIKGYFESRGIPINLPTSKLRWEEEQSVVVVLYRLNILLGAMRAITGKYECKKCSIDRKVVRDALDAIELLEFLFGQVEGVRE
ncbi:hypothetical protein E3E31_00030 [Thermococcus sp. M39]|uniref:hypothetical protein n=1 Tax=Thermococcus sp. M39 TaxID=1638262 RepID=UPI001439E63C|nr:hypothetical protein [Thermococcus sp. M39]NJE06944.1 hypothetical protein [Thermococcus sp. M39]